ncbi:MAG: nuclear transport factor 2 family protein [Acidobacteriia bacterium]|jgi:ketosteroid isomerase-like protein|nr:nuclear transport factor 2 family protein [Terriglobia bacterium]
MQIHRRIILIVVLVLLVSAAVGAQRPRRGNQPEPLPLPVEQQVDLAISEMLAGWQIGDQQLLRKYYADDVTVVSGAYEPPLLGWENYWKAYQAQRQRMQSVRLDRRNTVLRIKGDLAWATYQWEFQGLVDQQPASSRGHTTLILERQKDGWRIVHNHTSLVVNPAADAQPAEPN